MMIEATVPAMNPFLRLFKPLRTAAAAFFKHDVALRRAEGGVQIVLEQRPRGPKPKQLSREELAARKEKDELALMREQLAELLNEMPETRSALRHLVFVEQAITKKGLRALHKLPLDVLQRALEQFEGLVTNWSPAGLANLRSKIAVAIIDREHMDPEAEADAYRTAAVLDHTASVQPALGDEPTVESRSDDEALAAAYAALGAAAPYLDEPPANIDHTADVGRDAGGSGSFNLSALLPRAAEASADGESVEMQGELGSRSAKAAAREAARPAVRSADPGAIKLRELQR